MLWVYTAIINILFLLGRGPTLDVIMTYKDGPRIERVEVLYLLMRIRDEKFNYY